MVFIKDYFSGKVSCSKSLYDYLTYYKEICRNYNYYNYRFKIFQYCGIFRTYLNFSVASSPPAAVLKLKRVRACCGLGLGLRECCGCSDFFLQTIQTFSISALSLFCFHITCVFTGVALFISFKKCFPLFSQVGCLAEEA